MSRKMVAKDTSSFAEAQLSYDSMWTVQYNVHPCSECRCVQ